jgi:hypothetical protein
MADHDTSKESRRTSWLVGLATVGSVVTGVLALFGALYAFLSGQWQAAGVCFIAAAIAFGSLANSVLRR